MLYVLLTGQSSHIYSVIYFSNWTVLTNLQCYIFLEQDNVHEVLVPVLQTILDAAGADTSSSLVAIMTQFLKSQGKRRSISRRRQASLDLDSLKSQGKVSPQTFIQGWSLVTLRDRPLYKVGLL